MPLTRITPKTRKRAKELRREMTPPERILWSQLKTLKSRGCKFRRQAPIGAYIVDFVCFERNLVVELDGHSHETGQALAADKIRDAFLRQQGFAVMRIPNIDVVHNLKGVVETILREANNEQ